MSFEVIDIFEDEDVGKDGNDEYEVFLSKFIFLCVSIILLAFEKSLGIFYTYINENNNYKVNFHLMNYPDCIGYYNNRVYLIPKHYSKEIEFDNKAILNNPYPADRANETVNVIFGNYSGFTVTNVLDNNKKIEPGINYNPSKITLKITPENVEGIQSFAYTATRNDFLYGLIEGKTCMLNFNTPKCLEQCYSCTKTGTDEKHACLQCVNDSYYI